MDFMMNILRRSAGALAAASDGNPVISATVVIIFYCMFNVLEAGIEVLVFGSRFEHWLDPLFVAAFIGYACYSVYACAVYNSNKKCNAKG